MISVDFQMCVCVCVCVFSFDLLEFCLTHNVIFGNRDLQKITVDWQINGTSLCIINVLAEIYLYIFPFYLILIFLNSVHKQNK